MRYCQKCRTTKGKLSIITTNRYGKSYFYCRPCNRKKAIAYRKTKTGRDSVRKAAAKYQMNNSFKHNARVMVYAAVKTGKIRKPKTCSVCRKRKKLEGHHDDYSKPLAVKWVCITCHADIERAPKR